MPEVVRQTRRWLESVVVGLDLCPFARGPLQAGRVRFAASEAADLSEALAPLGVEIQRLQSTDPQEVETTLIVYAAAFADFGEFVEATSLARELVATLAHGELQLADFHPHYVFADVPASDPANRTNRSPHPMWHLLRESSVSRAVDSHPDVHGIPERNAALLRQIDMEQKDPLIGGSDPA